ncbi:hydrogenase maturation nickel metallochaperone HypA [Chromobacterium sp. IIBBL 290-4]|uniref:hydrogenase maturation nickel metallochaperone HypA n=1 Tax=Chromobacterium sp. IIBBL 290-4 TaxID=2953890 RepID=UPI0020B6E790|nr:hydrogenase maturation nickel metallochaperone HypA [Chromobacterium sp. IIBBL 290-4]UTH73058.1 hydrogenase maturation nickel metallochaperone HypA [Chromobacterium sp. IIBBL 290-4]
MHELTLAENVVHIAEAAARRAGARRVTRVRLALGLLAHVETDTLLYCCQLAARGSLAEDAEFQAERRPALAHCGDCGCEAELSALPACCPRCDGENLSLEGGDEMRVIDIGIS